MGLIPNLLFLLIISISLISIVSANDQVQVNASITPSMTISIRTDPQLENWNLVRTGINTIPSGVIATISADSRADIVCSMTRDGMLYSEEWGLLTNRLKIGGKDLRNVPGYEPVVLTTPGPASGDYPFDLTQETVGENYGNYKGTITCIIRQAI